MNPLSILVGLLGRGIGPSEGIYLHRTRQHKEPTIMLELPKTHAL